MCRDFAKSNKGVVLIEEDYAEKYQGKPNGEIQSKHFGKDASVSMEMRIVNYHCKSATNSSETKHRTITYAVLSDEPTQNASTTYQNMKLVLDDIVHTREEMTEEQMKFIVVMSDGCSVQYKYGAPL